MGGCPATGQIQMDDTHDQFEQSRASTVNRRAILRGVGVIGVAGVVGAGTATANNDRGRSGNGNPQEDCECPEEWGKYDFDTEACEFYFSEGDDLVEITYDPTDPEQNKDGEECEPIAVDFATVEHPDDGREWVVTKICSFGGTDNHSVTAPEEGWTEGTYEADLVNPGGQRAAISNITFCVEAREPEIPPEEVVGYQVDLIHGEPIEQFDPDAGVTYNSENRLLQAYWSGTGFDDNIGFEDNADEYQHCIDEGLLIHQDITINNGTASAELSLPEGVDPEDCSLDEFGLVSHSAPTDTWDPDTADQQEVYDFDGDPEIRTENGLQIGRFEVDLPPLL